MAKQQKARPTLEQADGPAQGEQIDGMGAEPAVVNDEGDDAEAVLDNEDEDEWEDRLEPAPIEEAPQCAPEPQQPVDLGPDQLVPTAEGCAELRVPRFVAREILERLGPDRAVARHRVAPNHKLVIVSTAPVTKFEVAIPLPLE